MEQETKYKIESKETADRIWELVLSRKYGEISSPETVDMHACYFDTGDRVLRKNGIALRTRREGNICFATMKWGSENIINGLFEHQEVNIPVGCDACFTVPPAELFSDSIDGKKVTELIEGKPLETVVETIVSRRRAMICCRQSIVELAIDSGEIKAGGKTDKISEIEIELYSGELRDVLSLTDKIAGKFKLEPENRTKYARGLAMLDEQPEQ